MDKWLNYMGRGVDLLVALAVKSSPLRQGYSFTSPVQGIIAMQRINAVIADGR
jgi:hypothetical protein